MGTQAGPVLGMAMCPHSAGMPRAARRPSSAGSLSDRRSRRSGPCVHEFRASVSRLQVIVVGRRSSPELDALDVKVITGVDVTDSKALTETMIPALEGKPLDILINNAGYFWNEHETLENLSMEEDLKQINICAIGPLHVSGYLARSGLIKENGRIAIISSQAGSTEWRFTQNPEGGDYGHHMSRAACNIAAVLLSQELKSKNIPVVMLHPGFNRTGMTAKYAEIWDKEGAVDPSEGAMRVLHEVKGINMDITGKFINCEDGLQIPW